MSSSSLCPLGQYIQPSRPGMHTVMQAPNITTSHIICFIYALQLLQYIEGPFELEEKHRNFGGFQSYRKISYEAL